MQDYIVTVKYDRRSILNKTEKFRVPANSELEAKQKVVHHTYYPSDGEIVSVKLAAYKKTKN